MKHLKPMLAALATTAIISVALVAHAADSDTTDQGDHRYHQRGQNGDADGDIKHNYTERRGPPFDKILNLTDAQKQTLAAAHAEQKASQQAFHEKLRSAHEALDKACDANADDATLSKLSNDLGALIAQQEIVRIKARRQFLSLLTADQKQKLDAFEAEHKGPPQWKQKHQDAPKG